MIQCLDFQVFKSFDFQFTAEVTVDLLFGIYCESDTALGSWDKNEKDMAGTGIQLDLETQGVMDAASISE